MRILRNIKSTRGDTIVEVLISLLVISAILVGAFVLSQRSSRNVRDSQEHSEALGLLQAQVELLRTAASLPSPGGLGNPTGTFCMDDTANVSTSCAKPPRYNVAINKTDESLGTRTYKFDVTWDAIGGGKGSETIYYRISI